MPNFNFYIDEETDKLIEEDSHVLGITKLDVLNRI